MKAGELVVQLKEARGIHGHEFLGLGRADAFAVFSLGGEKRNSRVIRDGGSNPVWNEQLRFKIAEYVNLALYNTLKVYLYDDDSLQTNTDVEFERQSLRGTVSVNIETLLEEYENAVPHRTYPVMYKGREHGTVEFALSFVPALGVARPRRWDARRHLGSILSSARTDSLSSCSSISIDLPPWKVPPPWFSVPAIRSRVTHRSLVELESPRSSLSA